MMFQYLTHAGTFFDLEILDDSNEPMLIVQTESFSQLGHAFKAAHNSSITYNIGDFLFRTRYLKYHLGVVLMQFKASISEMVS